MDIIGSKIELNGRKKLRRHKRPHSEILAPDEEAEEEKEEKRKKKILDIVFERMSRNVPFFKIVLVWQETAVVVILCGNSFTYIDVA
jgi:hypothetical protein